MCACHICVLACHDSKLPIALVRQISSTCGCKHLAREPLAGKPDQASDKDPRQDVHSCILQGHNTVFARGSQGRLGCGSVAPTSQKPHLLHFRSSPGASAVPLQEHGDSRYKVVNIPPPIRGALHVLTLWAHPYRNRGMCAPKMYTAATSISSAA